MHHLMFMDMELNISTYLQSGFFPKLCSAILGLAILNKILLFPSNPFKLIYE